MGQDVERPPAAGNPNATSQDIAHLRADGDGVAQAAARLVAGGLVAFPTETVYGLGALASDPEAVAAIFRAKGRPASNPLIVHVAGLAGAQAIGRLPGAARRLAQAFWPGPLTLVVPLDPGAALAPAVTAGRASVALRAPAHPVAQALLTALGAPLAAPSANPSGAVSPTTAAHVIDGLGGRIDAVLDGGPCPVGVESSIVGVAEDGAATLLRPGGLPVEAVEACLGGPIARRAANAEITAPGQFASHYAPRAALRLEARSPEPGEAHLGFGATGGDLNLSAAGDLAEAAANLFAHLRALDAGGATRIAVAPIPRTGLGAAINDRLARAAAPRPDRPPRTG